MPFPMATSIHGRRLGLSSTGGIITGYNSTGQISTALEMSARMWGPAMHNSVSSTIASTIGNAGFTTLSSASATAVTMEIAAPVQGVYKEIHIDTSASEMSFGGTSTAIVFASTLVGAGSTLFASSAPAGGGLADTVITLYGMSTARWAIMGSTTNLAVG